MSRESLTADSTICDLSGKIPFAFGIAVWRGGTPIQGSLKHMLVDVVTNDTFLDVSGALSTGLVSLVEWKLAYPNQEWYESTGEVLASGLFTNDNPDTSSSAPKVVRLKPVPEVNKIEPQTVRCILDPAITALLKDETIYSLRFPPEAHPGRGPWSGGLTWWQPCSDTALASEFPASFEKPKAKARKALKGPVVFKAMSDFPRPPHIEYNIEFSPNPLSLSSPGSMRITTRIQLLEAAKFTVMCGISHGPASLEPRRIHPFTFDLFDPETGEVLSRTPRRGNTQWSPYLHPMTQIKRQNLRELVPEEIYVAESDLTYEISRGPDSFSSLFRIKNVDALVNRRLGVKLRPVDTYWSTKSIDELFAETDILRPGQWYMPLIFESSATAEFRLVP